MSFKLMAQALDIKTGSPTAKLVLLKLCDNANDSGICWPSQALIAEQCEITRETVNRNIKKLIASGFVVCESQSKHGMKTVSKYKISLDVTLDHSRCDFKSHADVTLDHMEPIKNLPIEPKKQEKEIELPVCIDSELWDGFLESRKAMGKAVKTDMAKERLIKKLIGFEKVSVGDANAALDNAIVGGYQGLFAPKKQGQQKLTFPWPNLEVVENVAFPNGMLYVDKEKGICYETGGNKSDIYDWNKNLGAVTA